MGFSGSFALPVLRTVTMPGSCRAVTPPYLIRGDEERGRKFAFEWHRPLATARRRAGRNVERARSREGLAFWKKPPCASVRRVVPRAFGSGSPVLPQGCIKLLDFSLSSV